jgi:hypothetical protein
MKKCTKQYLYILGLGLSVLFLIYIYLAYPYTNTKEGATTMADSSTKKNSSASTNKTPKFEITPATPITAPAVVNTKFKACATITGTAEECAKHSYGSGIRDKCVYDTVRKRCIKPAIEYNPDGSVIDDGTNNPDEKIAEINDVDMKTGL